jgi:hypothetical protein
VLLAWARSGAKTDDPQWRELATLPGRWRAPACPIKSKAFTARGLAAGPQLGLALKSAEEAWIAAGFPAERHDLDAIVCNALNANQHAPAAAE